MPKTPKTPKTPPKSKAPWYSMVSNAVDGANVVNLHIFGEIGWDISAQEFITELEALGDVDQVDVEIGSVGGNVWDGLAIYNALLNHKAKVSVLVTSLAASMASVIALAADEGELRMMEQSMMMIHNPSTGAWGDQNDHQKAAKMLEKVREAMVGAYMRRYNGSQEDLIAMLDEETWLTATDCVENGLADAVVTQELDLAACLAELDLSTLENVPEEFLAIINGPKPNDEGEDGAALAASRAQLVSDIIVRNQQSAIAADKPEEDPMDPKEIVAAEKAAREAEAKRQRDIRAAFSKFEFTGSVELLTACIDDFECSVEMANTKLLAELGKDSVSLGGPAVVLEDARDKFRAGVEEAIEMRMNRKPVDHTNEFLSCSLLEMSKRSAEVRGVSIAGKDKFQIVAVALQPGSDFPGILENIATKEVLRGYSEQAEVYTTLARVGSLPDFKAASRTGLGHAPSLVANAEMQEVETIELADRKQSIQLATYAGKAGLSRVAIINDDLNEFGRMLSRLGAGAKRTVGDRFAAVFTTAAGLGQTLDEDSKAIFHADHSNTGTGGVPTSATFTELRVKMATQSDVGGNANLNIQPRFVYCPVALDGPCRVVNTSQDEVTSAKTARTKNIEMGRWEILSDARLDAASALKYYALADPNQTDTVEVAFLDGRDEPMIERVESYNVLGVEWVVWIDCVAQALDFRTMAYNAGS